MHDTLICPNCGHEIEISAALAAPLRERLRSELEQDATAKARKIMALEYQDVEQQLAGAKQQLASLQLTELQLRKDRRQLADQKQQLELTVTRQLDEERSSIRERAQQELLEQNRLAQADKDKLIGDLRRQIDDLQRKAEQGSQQAQGEVMEVDLEDLLRHNFPADTIDPVSRGTHGGDVLERVYDGNGQMCGTIVWESKRTKSWNDAWLPKLRDDQRAARAHLAVLFTAEMPKSLSTFGCIDGIWVTNRACLVGLAAALRSGLIEASRTRRSVEGKQTKVELVLQYLSGSEFRQRIEGIVEAFMTMQHDLETERRSIHRLWARREKQLQRAVLHTAGLYGDLGGITGADLPRIADLELAAIMIDPPTEDHAPADTLLEDSPF